MSGPQELTPAPGSRSRVRISLVPDRINRHAET